MEQAVPAPPRGRPELAEDPTKPTLLHLDQLVIANEGSACRDYLAFERNFLAWIKLVVSCSVISGALLLRLHLHELNGQGGNSSLEDKFAKPLGIIFFVVAMMSLGAATSSFFGTQRDMLRKMGHISAGHVSQATSILTTTVIGVSCVLLIISTEQTSTN